MCIISQQLPSFQLGAWGSNNCCARTPSDHGTASTYPQPWARTGLLPLAGHNQHFLCLASIMGRVLSSWWPLSLLGVRACPCPQLLWKDLQICGMEVAPRSLRDKSGCIQGLGIEGSAWDTPAHIAVVHACFCAHIKLRVEGSRVSEVHVVELWPPLLWLQEKTRV